MIFLRALRVSFVHFVTPKAFESKANSNGYDPPRIVVPGLKLDFDSPPAIFAGEDFNRKTLEPQETLSQGSHVVPEWLQLECGARASVVMRSSTILAVRTNEAPFLTIHPRHLQARTIRGLDPALL
jgi:hypothetical protein